MLLISKTSTLRGESRIGDVLVMTMTAEISSDQLGNSTTRTAIMNQELYAKNRTECRKDASDFQEKVYLIEDKFIEEGFEFKEPATK
ncbi:hypothetical protein P7H41_13200 [Vagococcus fluvialis]|uniref:hypothetical protein n=1 Tax=Vagococcus fluvialis TaxID=2738 RepID=UPI00288ED000|nr:hypothetical protein [Vagococcus fluvialis]MDT2782900.1 hypothetical protein [Vagococcus fluvialis]